MALRRRFPEQFPSLFSVNRFRRDDQMAAANGFFNFKRPDGMTPDVI